MASTPNQPRAISAYPVVDFNRLLQDAYSGTGNWQDWYMLNARGQISPEQYQLLLNAQPQTFGQRIGFSDRPTVQSIQRQAQGLSFPPLSSNATAQGNNAGTQSLITNQPTGMPLGSFSYGGGSTFHPVLPQGLQQQMEQLYGNTLSRLNSNFGQNGQSAINPILDQARRQFNEETIPSIAHRFTAMGPGAQRGSGFQAALGRAGSNLETDLAALQARYNLAERQQLLNALPALNPYEQVYNPAAEALAPQNSDIRPGWGRNLFPAIGRGLLGAAGGALSGFGTGGIPGAAVGGLLGAIGGGASAFGSSSDDINNITSRINQSRNRTISPLGRSSITPEQQTLLDDISRRAGPGVQLTPSEIQAIQAISGGGGGAAEDFQRTFKQPTAPLSYAQRMKLRKAAARDAALAGGI